MAIIKCKECGKEISNTIDRCIHCGYSFSGAETIVEPASKIDSESVDQTNTFSAKDITTFPNNDSVNPESKQKKNMKKGLIIASATSVLLVAGVIAFLQRGHFTQVIKVKDDTVYLSTGDDTTIEYEVYPKFADQGIEFSSDNENISVNEQGIIEATGEGSAEITISAPNGKTATVTVCSTQLYKDMSFDSVLNLGSEEFYYGSDFTSIGYDIPDIEFNNDKFELTLFGDVYYGTWTPSNKNDESSDDKGFDLIFDEGGHALAIITGDYSNNNKDTLLLYLDLDDVELCVVFTIND